MLEHELRADHGVLIVRPKAPLSEEDFAALSAEADAYIETHGGLNGLMISAERFPGWEDLDGLVAHFRFIRGHLRKIGKIAFVTDSDLDRRLTALLPDGQPRKAAYGRRRPRPASKTAAELPSSLLPAFVSSASAQDTPAAVV